MVKVAQEFVTSQTVFVMSSLQQCDSYSIEAILFYLEGPDIIRLVCCGSRILQNRVLSTRFLKFTWCGPGRSRWPSLLSSFTHLERFVFQNDINLKQLPCQGAKIENLPRSLKSLELRYHDPVNTLCVPDCPSIPTSIDLATLFPTLETLILESHLEILTSTFSRSGLVPSTLTTLDLLCGEIQWQSRWPATLRNLSIAWLVPCEDETAWNFPESLESFSLSSWSQSPFWISHLPSSVTSLRICVSDSKAKYLPKMALLPSSLKSLYFTGSNASITSEIMAQLPRTLEFLKTSLELDTPLIGEDAPTDSKLYRDYCERVSAILTCAPPSLTHMDFNGVQFAEEHLKKFPLSQKKLTLLNGLELSENAFVTLPVGSFSRLTRLFIDKGDISAKSALHLPPTITKLRIESISDELSESLNFALPVLEHISVRQGSLSSIGTSKLPRSITDIDTHDHLFQSLECLGEGFLPPNLSNLHIADTAGSSYDPSSISILSSNQTAHILPKSITSLSLLAGSWPKKDEWFEGLSTHHKLQSIRLRLISSFSDQAIKHMPNTLKSITISLSNVTAATLESLPRSLQSFQAAGGFSSKTLICDKDVVLLPKSLYSVALPHAPNLSSDCMPLLPNTLFTLTLGRKTPYWFHPDFKSTRELPTSQ